MLAIISAIFLPAFPSPYSPIGLDCVLRPDRTRAIGNRGEFYAGPVEFLGVGLGHVLWLEIDKLYFALVTQPFH